MGLFGVGGWLSRSSLEREVAGEYNTFRVYLLMLRMREASGRDVAYQLGFSSPALAVHHLEKCYHGNSPPKRQPSNANRKRSRKRNR